MILTVVTRLLIANKNKGNARDDQRVIMVLTRLLIANKTAGNDRDALRVILEMTVGWEYQQSSLTMS